MRQRLLERDDLSLEAALEQAYSLERAQQQSFFYSINVAASNVVLHHQGSADSLRDLLELTSGVRMILCLTFYHMV